MRTLLLLLLPFNAFALNCEFTWDNNPVNENVTHYTLYKDGALVADDINVNRYSMDCEPGSYTLTATNVAGESDKSQPVLIAAESINVPGVPSGFDVSITVNININ